MYHQNRVHRHNSQRDVKLRPGTISDYNHTSNFNIILRDVINEKYITAFYGNITSYFARKSYIRIAKSNFVQTNYLYQFELRLT